VIQHVERFQPQLRIHSFRYVHLFDYRGVKVICAVLPVLSG
jgi:hypothetical protein